MAETARAVPPLRAVIFDLDGTLVDSIPDIAVALNLALGEAGRRPLSATEVTGFVGNGVATLVERALEATGGQARAAEDVLASFRVHYDAVPAARTRPYPGVPEALERLAAAGLGLGVCTNKPEVPARRVLEGLGLARHFGAVVGGDTLASLKPDPAPLWHAAAALGAGPGEVVFVGDSETDAATAAAAGVPFALFTEGYRKTPVESFRAAFAFAAFEALVPRLTGPGGRA